MTVGSTDCSETWIVIIGSAATTITAAAMDSDARGGSIAMAQRAARAPTTPPSTAPLPMKP